MTEFFNKIFKKHKPAESTTPTVQSDVAEITPLKTDLPPVVRLPSSEPKTTPIKSRKRKPLDLPQLIAGCGHSVGRQREQNEDALFTLTTSFISDSTRMPFGLYIVADGMGGHQHGEIASGVSVRAMSSYVLRKLYQPLFGPMAKPPIESLQEIMQEGVYEAHRTILKEAVGGGTTLTAALILGEQLTITHVGDSRAYIIHPNGDMQALTLDHTFVKRLEELGQITAEEAITHPQRNVLYRALGQPEPFEPDVSTFPLPRSAYLLICSDGLWNVLPEKEILRIILTEPNPHFACQMLVDAANALGGPDNITTILVQMPD